MSEITRDEARKRAVNALTELAHANGLGALMIVDEAIVETPTAWYFPYDAAAFVLQGEVSAALTGNLAVKVLRDGAAVTFEKIPRS